MQKIEMCRKITGLGQAGQCTLVYSVIEDSPDFGISIQITEIEEEETVLNITRNETEIKELCDMLASNFVTPIALRDVVYDWICAV